MINIGSDFSGIGAFDFACDRVLGSENINNVFACDMDKFARESYLANHAAPGYYPVNVYDREIPSNPLDIYMTSPPCQGFSIAGNRKGSILFFNSHEFIQVNKPRYFIFENVKGLLSHEKDKNNKDQEIGSTFQNWVNWLGGKSVNGLPVLFPDENAVPYHIYWTILNSKEHGVPQNRERVFIVGIRDDGDNVFQWPRNEPLEKRLKDILETDVPDKYFLSDENISKLIQYETKSKEKGNGFGAKFHDPNKDVMSALKVGGGGCDDLIKVLSTNKGEGIKISQTLDSACNKSVYILGYTRDEKGQVIKRNPLNYSNTIHSTTGSGGNTDQFASVNSKIRRLTPRECLRLQDFPESFKIIVSDSQTYKQAGNSITVRVLEKIISKLKL